MKRIVFLWYGIFSISVLVFADSNPQVIEWKLRISFESASVRLISSSQSPVIGTMPKGTILNSFEAEGDWFRVVLPSGKDGIVIIGYIAKADVQVLEEKIKKQTDFWRVEEGDFKGLGFQAGAALEVRIVERAFLFFKVQGRYAKISAFKASDHLERQENSLPLLTIDTAGNIYFVPDSPYPRLAVFPEGSANAQGAQKAVFDFTGADLLAGILIRF